MWNIVLHVGVSEISRPAHVKKHQPQDTADQTLARSLSYRQPAIHICGPKMQLKNWTYANNNVYGIVHAILWNVSQPKFGAHMTQPASQGCYIKSSEGVAVLKQAQAFLEIRTRRTDLLDIQRRPKCRRQGSRLSKIWVIWDLASSGRKMWHCLLCGLLFNLGTNITMAIDVFEDW